MSQELAPKPPRRGLRRAIYCTLREFAGPASPEAVMNHLKRDELKGSEKHNEITVRQAWKAFYGMLHEGYLLRDQDGRYRIASRGHWNSHLGYRLKRAEESKVYWKRSKARSKRVKTSTVPENGAEKAVVAATASGPSLRLDAVNAVAPRPRKGYAFKLCYDLLLEHGVMSPEEVCERIKPDMLPPGQHQATPGWTNTVLCGMAAWGYAVRLEADGQHYSNFRVASLSEWKAREKHRKAKRNERRMRPHTRPGARRQEPEPQRKVSWLTRVLNRIGL